MTLNFFLNMVPPTVTAQERKVRVVSGRPQFYDTPRLKAARAGFISAPETFRPARPFEGALGLIVQWRFYSQRHRDGSYRVTRPDTDNLQKLLKDCMTRSGFWKDDAQVCVEVVSKRWARVRPGVRIQVVMLRDQ